MRPRLIIVCLLHALAAAPLRAQESGSLSFSFRDVAQTMGLAAPLRGMMAHAAAWGDVDRDGQADLWIGTFADRRPEVYAAGGASGPVPNILLMQRDGRFVPVENRDIAWKGRATGSVFADFDNDGWPGLYVSNNGRLGKENLFYGNQRGQLKLLADGPRRPLQRPATSRGVSVLDFDGDGQLDILVLAAIGKGPSRLFKNLGGLRFEPVDALPGDLVGLGLAIGDITGNGWPDVFVGGSNRLFVNQGGRFREATEWRLDWGFPSEDAAPSCGAAFGDIDRDGRLDLLIGTHTKRPWAEPVSMRLFRNAGSTVDRIEFVEVTREAGLKPLPMKTPHVEIRDFDNDGWPDLYTAVVIFKEGRAYPVIYKNLGATAGKLPRFRETAFVHRPDYPEADDYHQGMRSGDFYEALVKNRKLMYFAPGPSSDFDGDGRLDLILPSWFATRPTLLLKNETAGGNFVDVQVVGKGGLNADGIGAMVRAYPVGQSHQASALVASEQIATGYGYASGQIPIAHLGVGGLSACDIVVTLPHNRRRITLQNVKANQRIRVEPDQP